MSQSPPPTSESYPNIDSDFAESSKPQFNFEAYAKTIEELIANKENQTPMVVGIYGAWGTGKTTLMNMVKSRLIESSKSPELAPALRVCRPIWFQAWKYNEEDALLAALLEQIFKTMKADGVKGFDACFWEFRNSLDKNSILSWISGFISKKFTFGALDVSKFFSQMSYKSKLGFLDTFQKFFDSLIWTYIHKDKDFSYSKNLANEDGALVIFIDDLDRCPSTRVLKIMETIKLFLDTKGCVFVIGAAQEIIESAVHKTKGYEGPYEAEKFLEKMVQVTFKLPQKKPSEIVEWLKEGDGCAQSIGDLAPLVARSLDYNPRSIKRFKNDLSFMQSLSKNLEVDISSDALNRWSILEYAFRDLADALKANPKVIESVHTHIDKMKDIDDDPNNWDLDEDMLEEMSESTRLFFRDLNAIDLISKFPREWEMIETLCSLSASTLTKEKDHSKKYESTEGFDQTSKEPEEPQQGEEQSQIDSTDHFQKTAQKSTAFRIGPMVKIHKGKFKFGGSKEIKTIDHDFEIDAYPVTNLLYLKFIEDKGYQNEDHWSEDGWRWKKIKSRKLPAFWQKSPWNGPHHPVIGVSFYEAEAYAKWAEKRLPTVIEWERAARGEDGRDYPWGSKFNSRLCNSRESKLRATTPVDQYPGGISPAGCYDMCGNVWEWCSDWFNESERKKTMRGGAFFDSKDNVKTFKLGRDRITLRATGAGFRCARDVNEES